MRLLFLLYCAGLWQKSAILFGHIFGVKKASYTGQPKTGRVWCIKQDAVFFISLMRYHRLPPVRPRNVVYVLSDKGVLRPLAREQWDTPTASVQIIGATTENSEVLLARLITPIRLTIYVATFSRTKHEENRTELVAAFLQQESPKTESKNYHRTRSFASFYALTSQSQYRQVKDSETGLC